MEFPWNTVRKMSKKIIYYTDELNDEFSEAQIKARVIDKDFRYFLDDTCSKGAVRRHSWADSILSSILYTRRLEKRIPGSDFNP